ncbi:MAG: hypothetical protein CMJ59_10480 [Planctomycetaceae bacterium]|nr:hypothetical protein [Planctomycetaceae bacterium]
MARKKTTRKRTAQKRPTKTTVAGKKGRKNKASSKKTAKKKTAKKKTAKKKTAKKKTAKKKTARKASAHRSTSANKRAANKQSRKTSGATKRSTAAAGSLGRPKVTGEEKLFLLFKQDYHARQVFDFLRVDTVKELEQYSPDQIVKLLSQPIRQAVQQIRLKLAENNRSLADDKEYTRRFKERSGP